MEIPSITIFVRHSPDCEYRDDETYRKCRCKKHLRWTHNGRQRRQSAKTRTWSGAEEARRSLEAQFASGDPAPILHPPTVPKAQQKITAAVQAFITAKESEHKTPSTVRKLRSQLGVFADFMAKRSKFYPSQIAPEDVIAFRATWTSWGDLTKIKAQQNLRGFLRTCLKGEHRTDVLDALDTIKETKAGKERRKPKPLTEEELQKLLANVPAVFENAPHKITRHQAMIRLMASAGLAIIDTVLLERAVLERARKTGVLEFERQKTGKPATIPIDASLLNELRGVLNGNPKYVFWHGAAHADSETKRLQAEMRDVMKAAGVYIKGNIYHRLRDTAVDSWLGLGWSLTDIATALGDTVRIVERHYKDWASKRQQERLAKLPVRKW